MQPSPPSLDALHDIVLPPAIPWWPPAPGWYAVAALCLALAGWLAWRWWKHRAANAYRRAALRALKQADTPAAIAAVLRRTALAIAPRTEITSLSGERWTDWLSARCPGDIPAETRALLTTGVYRQEPGATNLTPLRHFARHWIARHHPHS